MTMCSIELHHIGSKNASLPGVNSTHDLGGYCTDHRMRVTMMFAESILGLS